MATIGFSVVFGVVPHRDGQIVTLYLTILDLINDFPQSLMWLSYVLNIERHFYVYRFLKGQNDTTTKARVVQFSVIECKQSIVVVLI